MAGSTHWIQGGAHACKNPMEPLPTTFSAPIFPKYVLLLPQDSVAALAAVLAICALASVVAIRIALRIDPAEAIG